MVYYCQKRCFVKNKNSDRNHCLLLSWFLPQICPKKLIFLYFSIVFLFIKTINNNKPERLIYTIMFDGKFFTAIAFTLILTLALIIGEITIGMVVARALNSKMKGQTFFRAWFFFPAVLSGLTVSLIFKQFFNYGLPTIGKILGISFLQESLLGTPIGAVVATIFVLLWQGVAMPIILFLAGLQSIPSDILEAASIDGATSKQTFWKIELPYLLPTISMVFILALKPGLTAFDQIFALTSGGPNNATTSLGLLVYNYAFKSNQYGYANAIALILFLIIGIVSLIQIKLSKKFEI